MYMYVYMYVHVYGRHAAIRVGVYMACSILITISNIFVYNIIMQDEILMLFQPAIHPLKYTEKE